MTLIVPWRDLYFTDEHGRRVTGARHHEGIRRVHAVDVGGGRGNFAGVHFDGEDFVSPGVRVRVDWSGYEPTA